MGTHLLRNLAIASFVVCMSLILLSGRANRKGNIPPIPGQIVAPDGRVLADRDTIMRGQDVYQRYGLMDHGSVWGHGTYRAMDFAADTLHRMGVHMRDFHATSGRGAEGGYSSLSRDQRVTVDARVIDEIKQNRYDPSADRLTLCDAQVYAMGRLAQYWDDQFHVGNSHVGFLPDTIPSTKEREDIAAFFFWTGWAAGTLRPGLDHTYTSNWPHDPSVGNLPMPQTIFWTILSIMGLLVVLGTVIYIVHRYRFFFGEAKGAQAAMELMRSPVTPSQRAAAKFFLVSGLLFLVQILNGGLLANYTVNPGEFYIKTVGKLYPYSWAKTWHVQLAILWIAIAWIGTAVYIAPLIGRREPRGQRGLVNTLFAAALIVVAGSLTGEVLSIKGMLGDMWYWLGHQGWEYLELGRLWQILLFAGLVFWLVIVYRTLRIVVTRRGEADDDRRALTIFYILSAILVVAFFGFGLFYHRGTHLTVADYWRWFVVHIWVESIFEFFGVAVVAMFLVTLGLVTARSALRVAYLTGILVFLGGIPGVAHHYYWYGGPSYWLAIGGIFSSLEVVPLMLLIVRAWMEFRSIRQQGIDFPYRWPLYFLVASSVWNFIGAGIFGFIINLPIVNYYAHSSYLTVNHAHTALFGTYGMLAISLILFSWRGLVDDKHWNDRILRVSFWGLNGGLAMMFITALLPIGLLQVWQTAGQGFWYARSASFYELPVVRQLAWWRIVPDTIVIVAGALPLLWFLCTTFAHLRKADGRAG